MLTTRSRRLALIGGLVAALSSAGCLNMERSVLINTDLSGRAGLTMAIDVESLIPVVLKIQHQSEGKTDPPTDAEIAAAKSELAGMAAMMPSAGPFDATKIAAALPQGMTVVESTQKMDGGKMLINLVIGFTDVTKVPLIAMPAIDQAPAGVDTSMKLFQDLEIKDEGSTISIASKPSAPGEAPTAFQPPIKTDDLMSGLTSALGMKSEDLLPLVNDMMKGMKVSTRIESPLAVVDTNAPTKNGASLTWSLSFDGGLEKMLATDPKSLLVNVRYKK